jgi:hypothetical protein
MSTSLPSLEQTQEIMKFTPRGCNLSKKNNKKTETASTYVTAVQVVLSRRNSLHTRLTSPTVDTSPK